MQFKQLHGIHPFSLLLARNLVKACFNLFLQLNLCIFVVLDQLVFEITAGRGRVVKSLSPWEIALKRDHPGK